MTDDQDRHLPRWRAPMDVEDARRYQTRAIKAAERIMYEAYEAGDDAMTLKAATRVTQGVQTLIRVIEAGEIVERIERLEEIVEKQQRNGAFHRN